jgi:hypothetical protein
MKNIGCIIIDDDNKNLHLKKCQSEMKVSKRAFSFTGVLIAAMLFFNSCTTVKAYQKKQAE